MSRPLVDTTAARSLYSHEGRISVCSVFLFLFPFHPPIFGTISICKFAIRNDNQHS